MRCYHKLEGGHWVPTAGEAGSSNPGRGVRRLGRFRGSSADATKMRLERAAKAKAHADKIDAFVTRNLPPAARANIQKYQDEQRALRAKRGGK